MEYRGLKKSTEYGVQSASRAREGTGWLEYGVQGKGLKKSTEYGGEESVNAKVQISLRPVQRCKG
jgi:hypothetical protein